MPQHMIIRDDDTSFFTTPALLERVYGRIWQAGIPVNLAVVPAVRGDTRVLHRKSKPYDPGIPPAYRGDSTRHPITDNPELVEFLNQKIEDGLVEICQHGFDHSYHEFGTDDPDVIRQKLNEGMALLKTAFPTAAINLFIAPYDHISPTALEIIFDADYAVCTLPKTLAPFPQYVIDGGYQKFVTPRGKPLFTAEEYLFNQRADPDEVAERVPDLMNDNPFLVLVNHYWMFFYDWAGTNTPTKLWDHWNTYVDALLALPAGTITSFTKDASCV